MPFDEVRFLVMLEFSLAVVVFSLLPLALGLLGMGEVRVWRSVSGVLGACLVFHVVGDYWLTFRHRGVSVQSVSWPIYFVGTTGNGLCALSLLFLAAGVPVAPLAGVYISCLLWLIVLSAIHFARLAWLVASSTD
jgi:hypothetical protein